MELLRSRISIRRRHRMGNFLEGEIGSWLIGRSCVQVGRVERCCSCHSEHMCSKTGLLYEEQKPTEGDCDGAADAASDEPLAN
ncbi:hypothetical protein AKJ16_DCAP26741 [Drosera capensis]